jgi:hypothetical protein
MKNDVGGGQVQTDGPDEGYNEDGDVRVWIGPLSDTRLSLLQADLAVNRNGMNAMDLKSLKTRMNG